MAKVRIGMTKKDANGKRFVTLRCDGGYGLTIKPAVAKYVLEGKAAPVVRWRGTEMMYVFHPRYLERLMMTFPDADISSGLRKRLQKREGDYERQYEDVEVPGFTGDLWGFQHDGVATCLERLDDEGVFMLNDEMGLGKTIQALCIMLKRKRKRVLVVTTKNGCGAWAKIMRKHFPRVKYVVVEGNSAQRAAIVRNKKVRVTMVNFEALRVQTVDSEGNPWVKQKLVIARDDAGRPIMRDGQPVKRREGSKGKKHFKPINPAIFKQAWDMLIVDEFHRCKNPEAQQTLGLINLPRCPDELPMSGTPFINNPLELWPILHRYWPDLFPDFYSFQKNLLVKEGGKEVGYHPDLMLALKEFLAEHSLRRRKDQVGIQMPPVVFTTVLTQLTAEQRRLYNRIKEEFELLLDNGEIVNIMGALPQITRLKQACFSPELYGGSQHSGKLDELHEMIPDIVESGGKAIIFTPWEKACVILRREFAEFNPAYVTGKTNQKYVRVNGTRIRKSEIEQDRFNDDDDCKLYIGTIKANQEAISLSAGNNVFLVGKEWAPLANDQAIARSPAGGLRGINLTGAVNVYEMFAEDTFEERVEEVLSYKRGLFDRMVESDGGRADERRRIEPDKLKLRQLRDLL